MRRKFVSTRLLNSLSGLVICACLVVGADSAEASDLEVERGDFTSTFLLTGELVAEDAALLVVPNANIWPVTVRWLEEDGAEVAEDETIVEFDNSQLATSLEELERSAIEAENQLASLRATLRSEEIEAELKFERAKAELEKARLDTTVPENLISQQDLEALRLAEERARLQFDQARENLKLARESAQARLEKQLVIFDKSARAARRAREGIALLTIKAPRDGILLVSDNDEEGRPFQTGDTTWPGRTIAQLPDLASMIVEAQLFDVDDGKVQPGMQVTAAVDAFPDVELEGKIIEVDRIANATTRRSLRRFFRTRVRLEGLDLEKMRPGMSVKVVVEDRRDNVLLVPRSAIGWSEASSVVAALPDGTLRPIEIGPCNRELCVLVSGLDEKDGLSSYEADERSTESGQAP